MYACFIKKLFYAMRTFALVKISILGISITRVRQPPVLSLLLINKI